MVCVTIGLFNFFVLLTKRSLYTGGITITWLSVDGCPVVRVHVSVNGEAQRVREHSTLPAQSCPVPYWLMGFLETPWNSSFLKLHVNLHMGLWPMCKLTFGRAQCGWWYCLTDITLEIFGKMATQSVVSARIQSFGSFCNGNLAILIGIMCTGMYLCMSAALVYVCVKQLRCCFFFFFFSRPARKPHLEKEFRFFCCCLSFPPSAGFPPLPAWVKRRKIQPPLHPPKFNWNLLHQWRMSKFVRMTLLSGCC